MIRPATLTGWLGYLETLHPKAIALGLERVRTVYGQLGATLACPVITVTGTNGKGSTCAMLEAMLRAAGYRVGLYTSPHLVRYNERVRCDGVALPDAEIVAAFEAVEDARMAATPAGMSPIPLTYFEFGTLAALWLFARARLDVVVLEVGLGGRLDAVNIVDPDVAVVTSVDIDHTDYLGSTREDIGREKAGIMRAGRPAVCGDRDPPLALTAQAAAIGAPLFLCGRDFDCEAGATQWAYRGPGGKRHGLPLPALRGAHQLDNAATALAALDLLRDRLPLSGGAVRDGLVGVTLPGRFQVLPGRPTIVLDVAHNPHAARVLAATLRTMGYHRETVAVFGMLADKDIGGVVAAMRSVVDRWLLATLPGPRGADDESLAEILVTAGVDPAVIARYPDVATAVRDAQEQAGGADRIVVFGSFLTVAAALNALGPGRATSIDNA